MTDDVAEPRDPKKAEGADAPPPPTGAAAGPAAGGTPRPESSTPPGPNAPPFWGYAEGGAATEGAFVSRYGLVRPLQGRYLAGVCAAIGRATNTDPILWRVLLAVLGFFGGLGVLVYVAAWLIIPAEGDDTSPFESMLGRGRSSMAPLTVILLSLLVVVLFGFIVADQLRAVLLGAAIIIAGVLLVSRNSTGTARPAPMSPPAGPPPPRTAPAGQTTAAAPGHSYPAPAPTPGATAVPSPASASAAGRWSAATASAPPQPPTPPPTGAYRPPFAPYGPYAGPPPHPPGPYPPALPRPPKPPAPPRESSPLGAVTFSMIFVAIGLVALLDLSDVIDVRVSGYLAAVLVTIALGLLVGAWFGRARWLIALGLVVTTALGISTVAESHRWHRDEVVWSPAGYSQLATEYEITVGEATLDLTRIDFTDQDAQVTVRVNVGEVTVIVPEHVDVTVTAEVNVGDAQVFGRSWSGLGLPPRELADYGADGPGGGHLHLYLYVNAGDLEVRR